MLKHQHEAFYFSALPTYSCFRMDIQPSVHVQFSVYVYIAFQPIWYTLKTQPNIHNYVLYRFLVFVIPKLANPCCNTISIQVGVVVVMSQAKCCHFSKEASWSWIGNLQFTFTARQKLYWNYIESMELARI